MIVASGGVSLDADVPAMLADKMSCGRCPACLQMIVGEALVIIYASLLYAARNDVVLYNIILTCNLGWFMHGLRGFVLAFVFIAPS